MGTPHKYAEVIKAWADGAEIQCRSRLDDSQYTQEGHPSPTFSVDYEWRVKPEIRGGKYRVGLFNNRFNNEFYTFLVDEGEEYETNGDFVRWLTNWVEYEYDPDY